MPSSYTTNLRLTLPVQGELSGSWGNTVNTGITALTDSAIAGTINITMTDATYTLSSVDGATDEARNMFVLATGTLTSAQNVVCPSLSKLYFFRNNTTGGFAVTLKTSAGAGISVPNGKAMVLYCNGTNVIDAASYFSSLTLGSALAVTSGGTGSTTSTGSGAVVLATSPTLVQPSFVAPFLGNPTSGNFSTGTFTWPTFNQNTAGTAAGLSATLVTSSGGTGLTSFTANGVMYASSTSALATGSVLRFDGAQLNVNGITVGRGAGGVGGNTTVGSSALASNITGDYNAAIGFATLFANVDGNYNTGVGANSAVNNVSGDENTSVGYFSLYANASGNNNTVVGYSAGASTLGSGNVMLGSRAGLYETGSNSFYIDNQNRTNTAGDKAGALLYGTFSATPALQTLKVNAKLTATYGVVTRVNTQTTTTSPWAWNSDSYDQQEFTALANALTINADAGTPANGQQAIFRFTDDGTARALTWTTGTSKSFRAVGVLLPTTTIANKTLYVGCIYNSTAARWDVIAVVQEA